MGLGLNALGIEAGTYILIGSIFILLLPGLPLAFNTGLIALIFTFGWFGPNALPLVTSRVYGFITERLRRYFLDRDTGLSTETFDAVMARQPSSLVDFDRRLAAVQTFVRMEQAESLAAANKRIANILRKAGDPQGLAVDEKLFELDAERALGSALEGARSKVAPMLGARQYAETLNELAGLRDPVDRFFDDVMVMADDEKVRNNRLALLTELRALFLDVADISRLAIG